MSALTELANNNAKTAGYILLVNKDLIPGNWRFSGHIFNFLSLKCFLFSNLIITFRLQLQLKHGCPDICGHNNLCLVLKEHHNTIILF